jgi:hypothetical protein
MRMLFVAPALMCALALAQTPTDVFEKAPPDVDQALRARVSKFFQAHVDGKFRLAEQVIHEDSQDSFYNAEKQRYLSFEIVKIQYTENFTRATVVTQVELDWYNPRIGKMRVKPPVKGYWKRENGEWWWYVIPQKDWETPFGRMTPGPMPSPGVTWGGRVHGVADVDAVYKQVQVTPTEVVLQHDAKSEQTVEITNGMSGDISLRLETPDVPGMVIKAEKETVESGQAAKIRFTYTPPDKQPKRPMQANIVIEPTGRTVPIQINFTKMPPVPQEQRVR